jgi:hypothetical protein
MADVEGAGSLDQLWEVRAKNLLKAELRRHGITYKVLAARLQAIGLVETDRNISNKINRGAFSAVFLLQCLHVIGVRDIRLPG